jgi:hypothetical protein
MAKALCIAAILFGITAIAMGIAALSRQQPHQQTDQAATATANAEQEHHETGKSLWQRWSDWWNSNEQIPYFTGWLAIFSGLLVAVSIVQIWLLIRAEGPATQAAQAAARSANVASAALVASNRPWIKISVASVGPITYNENGANFEITYALKNVGKSPALGVYMLPWITFPILGPGAPPFDPRAELMAHIAQVRGRDAGFLSYTVFPGEDPLYQRIIVSISKPDIARATKDFKLILPTIICVARYSTQLDQFNHVTGDGFDVRRANNGPGQNALGIDPKEGDVAATDVRVGLSPLNLSYAD